MRIPADDRRVLPTAGVGAVRLNSAALLGNGVQQLGEAASNAVNQVVDAVERSERQEANAWGMSKMAEARLDWTKRFEDLKGSAAEGAPAFTPSLMKEFDDYRSKVLDTAPSERAKALMEEKLTGFKTELMSGAMAFEAHSRAAHGGRLMTQAVELGANTVRSDASQLDKILLDVSSGIEGSPFLGADKKAEAQAWAARKLSIAAVENMIERDPSATRERLSGGLFGDRIHLEDKDHLLKLADATVRQREAEAERQQREREQQLEAGRSRWLSDFEIKLSRGEVGYQDVEQAYSRGMLKPHERTQAVLRLDRRLEEEGKAVAELGRVGAAIAGEGLAMDPRSDRDRKAVDAHYALTAKGWEKAAPQEQMERTLRYASQPGVGMLPTPVKTSLRGWLRAGTPEQKVMAADMMARIRSTNPQLLNDIADEDLAVGNLVGTYASYGVPPAEAVRLAEEGLRAPKAERDARGEQYRELTSKSPADDYLRSQLNGSWLYRALPGANPDVPAPLVEEFDRLARTEFERHGNMDAARKTALDTIGRVWGVSRMGDGVRWMKGAPENFYGAPGMDGEGNAKWMREQLAADLQADGGMFDPNAGPVDKRAVLFADPYGRVDRETGHPLYMVMLKAPNGHLNPVLGADGRPRIWRPDWSTSPEFKRREAERQRLVEEARAAHAGRGSVNAMMEAP